MRFLKGIVLLLALANVGYYLYAHGIAAPVSGAPAGDGSPALKLAKQPLQPVQPPSPRLPVRCVSIGPFVELADSNRAQSTLHAAGYAPRQRSAESEVADGVLVFLPMPTAAAAVVDLRKRLKAAGIADAPDAPGPGDAIVIWAPTPTSRTRRPGSMHCTCRGFTPLSLERKRSGMVYWLDVDLKAADPAISPADLHIETLHGPAPEVHDCPEPGTTGGAADAAGASVASSAAP